MSEVIVGADVEALIISYLESSLTARPAYVGTPVGTKVPDNRHEIPQFVTVTVTGGAGRTNTVIDDVNVTVDAWAGDAPEAHDLAQLCRGLLHIIDLVDGVQFYRVTDFSAPGNLPDPATGQARYRATYAVRVRAYAA